MLAGLGDVGNRRSEEGRTEHGGQVLQGHLVELAHRSHPKNVRTIARQLENDCKQFEKKRINFSNFSNLVNSFDLAYN